MQGQFGGMVVIWCGLRLTLTPDASPGSAFTDLTAGTCLPCHTYGDCSSLASTRSFLVESVQLWELGADDASKTERRQAAWEGDAEGMSVLEPGQNKLMLEFIGMEREVAMERRFS